MTDREPPLLPLVLDRVHPAWSRMLAQAGVPAVARCGGEAQGRWVLFDGSRSPPPQALSRGQATVDVGNREVNAWLEEFDAVQTCRTVWRVGVWEAAEQTAALDRRDVSDRALVWLRTRLESAGGVWMRLTPFPSPYRTAAAFRFDHDSYVANDFAAVLDAIAGHEAMTTHFVCAATHEGRADALSRLRDLDVGAHGYYHHTYRTATENVANIVRGIDALTRHGLTPVGFAAPHGRYHAALAAALRELKIPHSSEFALAYDALPFVPSGGDTLQIPVHPVCLGIVLEAVAAQGGNEQARAADAVAEYFIATAQAKHANREPIFFYGHPDGRLGRYPGILTRLFHALDELPAVWQTSFREFARWWRQRAAVCLTVTSTGDGWRVRADNLPVNHRCRLEVSRGDEVAEVELDGPIIDVTRASFRFELRPRVEVPRPVRREHLGGFKHRLRTLVDWERVTPTNEIRTDTWRGRVKRLLRAVKG